MLYLPMGQYLPIPHSRTILLCKIQPYQAPVSNIDYKIGNVCCEDSLHVFVVLSYKCRSWKTIDRTAK